MKPYRRKVLIGLAASIAAPGMLHGQTVPRVAVLAPGSRGSHGSYVEAFRKGMQELGYAEGRNVAYDIRWTEGRIEPLPEILRDVLRLNPTVIVAQSSPAVQAAKAATATVPIVIASAGDPIAQGLVTSLVRPGGNITGISLLVEETIAKEIELLHQVVPNATRVALLVNPLNPFYRSVLPRIEAAAEKLKVRLLRTDITNAEGLDAGLAAVAAHRPQALIVTSDSVFGTHRKQIIEFTARNRIPTMYAWGEAVNEGGLMSYVPSMSWRYHRAASYVGRILKGANAGDLPMEQPTRFELVVNQKTAKALGITIPQSVLVSADRVIE